MKDSTADERRVRRAQKIQRQLDEALAATFPASDPVSIEISNEEEDWGTEALAPEPPPAKPPRIA